MKILSVNAGSSSLKFTLFELPEKNELISGTFEKIGIGNSFYTIKINGEKIKREVDLKDHGVAVNILIEELLNNGVISSLDDLDGIGHRVVNGGPKYSKTFIITDEFMEEAKDIIDFAPVHNPAHITGIKAFREALPTTPQTVVFDTAFHSTMEPTEYLYAVPYEWFEKYSVRKYGAHGTSHRYVYKTICEYMGRDDLKVINCHLGNGSSLCAVDAGRVVDTSMGFTPLVGVPMGTRSGDIDPSIIPYIMLKENKTCQEVIDDLNKKSGLLGISGVSSDSRDIEDGIKAGNERCALINEMLCRRIANYIAMYNNMLNGADVITFTAGIGENSAQTRQRVIELVQSLGVKIDPERNDVRGKFTLISTDDSKMPIYIVPTNEELMIAMETYDLIK